MEQWLFGYIFEHFWRFSWFWGNLTPFQSFLVDSNGGGLNWTWIGMDVDGIHIYFLYRIPQYIPGNAWKDEDKSRKHPSRGASRPGSCFLDVSLSFHAFPGIYRGILYRKYIRIPSTSIPIHVQFNPPPFQSTNSYWVAYWIAIWSGFGRCSIF